MSNFFPFNSFQVAEDKRRPVFLWQSMELLIKDLDELSRC